MSFSFCHLCSSHKVTIAAISRPVQWPLAFLRHWFQEALQVTTGDSLIQRCPCPPWVTCARILLARASALKHRAPTLTVCFVGPLLTPSTMSFGSTQEINFTRYFKQDKGRALVLQDLQGSERKGGMLLKLRDQCFSGSRCHPQGWGDPREQAITPETWG